MRTTFNLDDELLGEAQRLTGVTERTALIHEGLRALIQRESARRLARLGATEPSLRCRRAGVPEARGANDPGRHVGVGDLNPVCE